MSEAMKLSILLRAEHFMGDHAEVFVTVHELKPGETVEDLAGRLFTGDRGNYENRHADVIEIRRVVEGTK